MKTVKFLFIMMLVALSSVVYAQILEQNDIDIFVNGYSTLAKAVSSNEFEDYQEHVEDLYYHVISSLLYVDDLSTDDFNVLLAQWLDFLEIKAPRKFEAAFRAIGWETNGHKKYWTILIGLYALDTLEDPDHSGTDTVLDLFHKQDITLLKENKDMLMALDNY